MDSQNSVSKEIKSNTKDNRKRKYEQKEKQEPCKETRFQYASLGDQTKKTPGVEGLQSLLESAEDLLLEKSSYKTKLCMTQEATREFCSLVDRVKASSLPSDPADFDVYLYLKKSVLEENASRVQNGDIPPKSLGAQLRDLRSGQMHISKTRTKHASLTVDSPGIAAQTIFSVCLLLWDTLLEGICAKTARVNFQKRSPKICAPLERVRLCLVFLQRSDVQLLVKLGLDFPEKEAIGALTEYANSALRILRPSSIPVDAQLEEMEHDLRTRNSQNGTFEVLFHRKIGPQRTQFHSSSFYKNITKKVSSVESGSTPDVAPHTQATASPVHGPEYICSPEFDEIYSVLQERERQETTHGDTDAIRLVNEQLKTALYEQHHNDFTLLRQLVANSTIHGMKRDRASLDVFDVLENSMLVEHATKVLDGASVDATVIRKTSDEIWAIRDTWRKLRSNKDKRVIHQLRGALPPSKSECTVAHVRGMANHLFWLLSKGRMRKFFTKDCKPANLPILDQIAICLRFLKNDVIHTLYKDLTQEEVQYLSQLISIGGMALDTIKGPFEGGFKKLHELRDLVNGIPQNNPFPKDPKTDRVSEDPVKGTSPINNGCQHDDMGVSDHESRACCDGAVPKDNEEAYTGGSTDSFCNQMSRRSEDDPMFHVGRETSEQPVSKQVPIPKRSFDSADMEMSDDDMPKMSEGLESRRPLATVVQNPSSSKDSDLATTGAKNPDLLQSNDIKAKQLALLKAKRLLLRKRIETNKRDGTGSGPSAQSSEQQYKGEVKQYEATADHDKVSPSAESDISSSCNHESAGTGGQTGASACARDGDAFVEGPDNFTVSVEKRRDVLKKKIASALRKKRRLEEAKGARVSVGKPEIELEGKMALAGKQAIGLLVEESDTGKVQREARDRVPRANNLTTAVSVDELDRRDLLQRREAAEQNTRLLHFQRLVSKQETMLEHQASEIDSTGDRISKLEVQMENLESQLGAVPLKVNELKSRQEIIEGIMERNRSELKALHDKYSI